MPMGRSLHDEAGQLMDEKSTGVHPERRQAPLWKTFNKVSRYVRPTADPTAISVGN